MVDNHGYAGCYLEDREALVFGGTGSKRVLLGSAGVSECATQAQVLGVTPFGVSEGRTCWFGNAPDLRPERRSQRQMACFDNGSDPVGLPRGGASTVAVFRTPTVTEEQKK